VWFRKYPVRQTDRRTHHNTSQPLSRLLVFDLATNFRATDCKTLRPILSVRCLSVCLSVLSVCLSVTLVYCGQTVGWIKMKFGMEVGLGPGHIVLDGNPAPPPSKGAQPPIFGPCLLWPNGWIDQDATWYGGRPRPPGHIVLHRDPAPPPKRGTAPNFRPMSIVAKRSSISATAEHRALVSNVTSPTYFIIMAYSSCSLNPFIVVEHFTSQSRVLHSRRTFTHFHNYQPK